MFRHKKYKKQQDNTQIGVAMATWNEIFTALLYMVGFNLILTFILMLVILKYPKYVVLAYNRYLSISYGLSKKYIKLKSSFSYCYYERGEATSSAPSLLLVHGFSSSKDSWLGLLKHLPRRLHVIALDLPGHGGTSSKKEDLSIMLFVRAVHEFVNAVGLNNKKFHILGCSMGGHIAGMYAVEHPENLLSVVLGCPHGILFKKQQEMIDEAIRTQEFSLLPQTKKAVAEMFATLSYKKMELPDIILSGILQLRLERNEFYRRLGEALIAPDSKNLLERNLHKLDTPVFLIWGKEDQILDVECVATIQKKLPSPPIKTLILDDVGHVMFMEVPKKLSVVILDFINSYH